MKPYIPVLAIAMLALGAMLGSMIPADKPVEDAQLTARVKRVEERLDALQSVTHSMVGRRTAGI